jgi:hypothetical protein
MKKYKASMGLGGDPVIDPKDPEARCIIYSLFLEVS